MKYRRFTQEFKRSLIEQLLSETATPTELCRRYNISSVSSPPGKGSMLRESWILNHPKRLNWPPEFANWSVYSAKLPLKTSS